MSAAADVQVTHQGVLFSVEVLRFRDRRGREVTREVVRHPGAVLVVPVLADGRIVMIRNYRIAPDERLWEMPAGKLEPGEEPAKAAARELEEETGYLADQIVPLGRFYTSPGFADEMMHVYLAEGLQENNGQRLEAGEDIEVEALPASEVLAMARDGRLRDGKTLAALLLWETARSLKVPASNETERSAARRG